MTSSFSLRAGARARRAVVLLAPVAACSSAFDTQAQNTPPIALDPVIVIANRLPQPLSTVLADVSVVDRAAIERSGAMGVADLLARLPGIEITRTGGPASVTGVFLRGSEARHTAVYIDGVRIDSQATGGATWEQIPLEQIERIEVLRGPAAAVYGSDAVAGVVQLFTKRGEGLPRPSVSVLAGSYGTAQVQLGVSGSTQALDYALSASHGRSSGFNARTTATANPDDDGWKRSSLQGRVGFQIDRVHRLDASLLASNLRAQFDGFTPGADDVNLHSLRSASLAWEARWNEGAKTRLQLGQSDSTLEIQPDFYRSQTTLRNLTLQHEQRLGVHLLSATLERRDDELFNPATAFSAALEGKRHQNGIGLGWRADFGAHGLQAHLRRDEDSEFGGKSTGSLAWGWAFVPEWRLTASAATSFRVPTLYQRFSPYGNASLVPETGRSIELGLRWGAGGNEASLTAWRNRVGNLIDFGDPGPCLDAFGCYVNVGSAQLKGATLAGHTTLAGVTLRGSLDWHDPRNRVAGTLLPRRAKKLANLGAETQLGGWTVGAEVQAVGARFDNAANTQPLGGYGLVNLFVGKVLMPGLTFAARIDNVGDKAYELARTYATAGRNGQLSLRWAMP